MNMENKLKSSIFFIEANSFERLMLWKEHKDKTNWEEDNTGFCIKIGEIDPDKPIYVTFSFAKIYGSRICFYEVTSRYSDSEMVENYIKDNYSPKWDNGTRNALTNAMNFPHAIGAAKNI